ncbi:MAG: phosphoribosylglycinamide formyltransferase [Vicinamibacterales bacterium]
MKESGTRRRIAGLISGRGSNLQALIDAVAAAVLPADIAVVLSNRPGARGLARAERAGIETLVLNHRDFPDRDVFDTAVAGALRTRGVELVCLAGFMRLVGGPLLGAFPEAILNIHPSLLPAFPGADAPAQAIAHGVKVSGATVHFVTGELDGGPIIMQSAVPVDENDTAELLAARILSVEHRLYPQAVRAVLEGDWRVEGRRFRGSYQTPGTSR